MAADQKPLWPLHTATGERLVRVCAGAERRRAGQERMLFGAPPIPIRIRGIRLYFRAPSRPHVPRSLRTVERRAGKNAERPPLHPRPFRETPAQTIAEILRTPWTGATGEVAWILEGIARDEIFDGTLDGASENEIENAFKEAMRTFRSDERRTASSTDSRVDRDAAANLMSEWIPPRGVRR